MLFFLIITHNFPRKIRLVFRIQLLCKQHSPEKFFLFGIKHMMIRLFPKMGNNIRKFLRCQCRTFLQIRSGIHQGIQPVRDTVDISLAFPILKQNGIFPAEKGHVGTSVYNRNDLRIFHLLLVYNRADHMRLHNYQLMRKQNIGKTFCKFFIHQPQFEHVLINHRQIIVHMFLLDLFHGKTAHHPAILFINFRFAFL